MKGKSCTWNTDKTNCISQIIVIPTLFCNDKMFIKM